MFVAETLFALELIALAIGFLLILIASTNVFSGLRNAGYVVGGIIVFGALALMIVSAVFTNKYGRLTVPVNQYIQQLTGREQVDKEEEKSEVSNQEIEALRQQVQQQTQQIQQNSTEIQQNRQTIRNLEQEQIEDARRNASNAAKKSSINTTPESEKGVSSQTSSIMTLIEEQKACRAKKCGIPKKGR